MSRGKRINYTPEWMAMGINRSTYYYRLKYGLPSVKGSERFSGLEYENSPEKLDAIKEKYKNGVSMSILSDFVDELMGVDTKKESIE